MTRYARWTALLTLLAGPCLAANPELQKYLTSIAVLYENFENERALERIGQAKSLARGPEDDVAVALYEGIVLGEMDRMDEAARAFKTALRIDPDAKLPFKVSPKMVSMFEGQRAKTKSLLNSPPAPAPATSTSQQAPRSGGARSWAWVPALAGGVAAGGAAFCFIQEKGRYDGLVNGTAPVGAAAGYRSDGKLYQAVGVALAVGAAVGWGVAGAMRLWGAPDAAVQPVVALGPGFTAVAVSGAWP